MYSLEVMNEQGVSLKLTQNESRYQIVKVEGLTPPASEIFTAPIATTNGEKFKHSRIEMRNIVITIKLNGAVEQNRIALYDFFTSSRKVKLTYRNGLRHVYIEGYCETVEGDLFELGQKMQISILCPDPYLRGVDELVSDLSKQISGFEFPFAIEAEGIEFSSVDSDKTTIVVNAGDSSSGMIIEITCNGEEINNPVIYNYHTGQLLRINDTLLKGEKVIINTKKGSKSITKITDGYERNIINKLDVASTWLQLNKGANYFTYSADDNESYLLKVVIKQESLYLGV